VAAFFALVAATAGACGRNPTSGSSGTPTRPDLLLITIDTLRADRVGKGLTPALDALATRGVHFTQARATAPLTLPSHVSILTGALPPTHGVRENGIHAFTGTPPSIAQELKNAGYQTAAFVGAYVLDRRFGLADGFDHYDDQITRDSAAVLRLEAERPANEVVDRALAWAKRANVDRKPAFIWVHLYDPHAPHPESYDADVRFADAHAGRLLDELRALGRQPVVIVAGDHGESLGEHGERTHGMLLYDAALRAPLIIAGSGITPGRRDAPVSLADVAATLLVLAGSTPGERVGRDLLGPQRSEREIYAETEYPRVAGWSPVYALLQDRWKLILSADPELYDISADPAESHNVASARQQLVGAMSARLQTLRSSPGTSKRQTVPPDVADRLRALGYVAASAEPPQAGGAPNPADHIAAWGEFEAALAAEAAKDDRAALARLKPLAERYPDARVFQSAYARILAESGSSTAALRIYRRAVQRWPTDAVLFHELAVTARSAGLADEAMRAEQAAIAIEPNLPSAHNGIGLLLTDTDQHVSAAASFERAVKADPTNAEYWVNLGNARRAAGNTNGAADAYRAASELEPRSPDAANGLGVILVQQHRPLDAIPWFQRALEASPEFVEVRLNLGIAYQESGQHDRAREAYGEVLARASRSAPERRAAVDLLRSLPR
jgi:arylsulfatase A-like enzyme/cytochrome c-type biogenesis protein CcmH/NrfG